MQKHADDEEEQLQKNSDVEVKKIQAQYDNQTKEIKTHLKDEQRQMEAQLKFQNKQYKTIAHMVYKGAVSLPVAEASKGITKDNVISYLNEAWDQVQQVMNESPPAPKVSAYP